MSVPAREFRDEACETPCSEYIYVGTEAKRKKRIRQLLSKRGLASKMSDTKWRKLCKGINTLPFPPAYQSKDVDVDEPQPSELPYAPSYFGDWAGTPEASFGLHIEWVKIAPRYSRHRGNLISPEIQDCLTELTALLRGLRLPFSEEGGFILLQAHG